ncbi:hypothetical protein [Ascidiaceihabitans sp.]|uniref:hypothetical protein n=1 Tax=Ascidiaceihabitans sp. TaxID=1872644 RepID=UPI003297D80B
MDNLEKYVEAGSAAKTSGGFTKWLTKHAVMFYPRSNRLVVTFDNMKSRDAKAPVYPWGYNFVAKHGWSHLGIVMVDRNDWFRHPSLWACLDRFRKKGFFEQFDEVVFYGSSMGGYGALAYAPLSPGATVVALTPQTSLDPRIVPFETRFPAPFNRGTWTGPYADGVAGAASAQKVYVLVDPFFAPDAQHVMRLQTDNLIWLKTPHLKNQAANVLKNGNLLSKVVPDAWNGTLTAQSFDRQFDALRLSKPFARVLIHSAIDAGHYDLAERALDAISAAHPKWAFSPLHEKLQGATGDEQRH